MYNIEEGELCIHSVVVSLHVHIYSVVVCGILTAHMQYYCVLLCIFRGFLRIGYHWILMKWVWLI